MSLLLYPLSSVFFYFDVSLHFSPPNGLERSQNGPWRFNIYDSHVMVLKEVKMVHGGLTTGSNVMVLKEVNLETLFTMYVSDGLESSQFCLYTQWS